MSDWIWFGVSNLTFLLGILAGFRFSDWSDMQWVTAVIGYMHEGEIAFTRGETECPYEGWRGRAWWFGYNWIASRQ